MTNLREVVETSVIHWTNKIESDLKNGGDQLNILNSIAHLRRNLMLLGISPESLPQPGTKDCAMSLVRQARQILLDLGQTKEN